MLMANGGMIRGGKGNDVFNLVAENGSSQIHAYDWQGDDVLNLRFHDITKFSNGHHVRGDAKGGSNRGNDVFNFMDLGQVHSTVVGRIEDFDASRDTIKIEGKVLDLHHLPSNVRIVEFNGAHNDPGADPQQWILINTKGGHIFYALEGARVDMNGNGGANPASMPDMPSMHDMHTMHGDTSMHHMDTGTQESHFISAADLPNFGTLTNVAFIDQKNYVPAGFKPQAGGVLINDTDENAADVTRVIHGSTKGDAIAAGLNDDTVSSGDGNDLVWGGSGHDKIFAGSGNDTVWGGTGNDKISGGTGDDRLYGDQGNDALSGGDGSDHLDGGNGNDVLYGDSGNDAIFGGTGRDVLNGGAGSDRLYGGSDGDILFGGDGADQLDGGAGWDWLFGGAGDDVLTGGSGYDKFIFNETSGNDVITDFDSHNYEKIDLRGVSEIDNFRDLVHNHLSQNAHGDAVISFGDNSITLVGYSQQGIADGSEHVTALDFFF